MDWVLLHLSKDRALEDVAEEAIMSFFETLKVVLKDLIFSLKDLNFSKGQSRIQAKLDVVEHKDLSVDGLDVQVPDQVGQVVFADSERVCRHHAVIHVRVRFLTLLLLRRPDLLLNFVVDPVSDDGVNLVDDLLVGVQVQLIVVEADNDLRIASVHSLADGCVYLQVQHLDVPVQHHILL